MLKNVWSGSEESLHTIKYSWTQHFEPVLLNLFFFFIGLLVNGELRFASYLPTATSYQVFVVCGFGNQLAYHAMLCIVDNHECPVICNSSLIKNSAYAVYCLLEAFTIFRAI